MFSTPARNSMKKKCRHFFFFEVREGTTRTKKERREGGQLLDEIFYDFVVL